MRIRELQLIKYGKFTNHQVVLPQREQDIHVIVGPNEAGKSTLRAAISDWLFGIPVRTQLAFKHAMPELRIGGVLEGALSHDRPPLAFTRSKGNKNTLRDANGLPLADDALRPWLGSLDEAAFKRMYALDHDALVAGSAGILSESDDVGRLLFRSAAGLAHLGQAFAQLNQEADALWAPRRAAKRKFYQDLDAYNAANAELQQASLSAKAWEKTKGALSATQARLVHLRGNEAQLRQQINRLERLHRVRPMLDTLDRAQAEHQHCLRDGGAPSGLPANAAQLVQTASRDLALARAEQQRLTQVCHDLSEQLNGVQWPEQLLASEAEIAELDALRQRLGGHERELPHWESEVQAAWLHAQTQADALGWAHDSEARLRVRLPAPALREQLRQLVSEQAVLAQQVHSTHGLWQSSKQQLLQVTRDFASLADVAMDVALAVALAQAHKLGDHDARVRDAQQAQADAAKAVARGLAELGQGPQTPEALQSMVVPPMVQLQAMLDQRRDDERVLQRLSDELASQEEAERQWALVVQQSPPQRERVTVAQLQQARDARDALLAELMSQGGSADLAQGVLAYKRLQQQADQLGDARLASAQHEVEQRLQAEQLRMAKAQTVQRLAQQRDAMGLREQAWRALAQQCSVPELPLDVAQQWFTQRETVLQAVLAQAHAQDALVRLLRSGREAQMRLWQALAADAPAGADMPELAVCIRQAQAQQQRIEHDQGKREVLAQRKGELGPLVQAQHAAHQAATRAWVQWQGRWQAALRSAGYKAQTTAAQVGRDVGKMDALERALERMHSLRQERIEPMRADLALLADRVADLVRALAPDLQGGKPADVSQALVQRMLHAKTQARRHADIAHALQRCQQDLARQQALAQAAQAEVQPLLDLTGAADVDALQQCIVEVAHQRVLAQRVHDAEQALLQAADGHPLAPLRADVLASDAEAVQAALLSTKTDLLATRAEMDALSERRGVQDKALKALDGSAHAAQAEGLRQEAMASMVDTVERYLKRRTEAMLLQWALDQFRETQQGPMLRKASVLLNTLSGGSFERLTVDASSGQPRLLCIREADPQGVELKGLSEGTRDQLFLALRLAALSLQAEQGSVMPLIADDLFINFDEVRTAAGLQVLGALSRHMQVLVLTHHEHVVQLAQEVLGEGLNVVRL